VKTAGGSVAICRPLLFHGVVANWQRSFPFPRSTASFLHCSLSASAGGRALFILNEYQDANPKSFRQTLNGTPGRIKAPLLKLRYRREAQLGLPCQGLLRHSGRVSVPL
jgi:hypothetical protein